MPYILYCIINIYIYIYIYKSDVIATVLRGRNGHQLNSERVEWNMEERVWALQEENSQTRHSRHWPTYNAPRGDIDSILVQYVYNLQLILITCWSGSDTSTGRDAASSRPAVATQSSSWSRPALCHCWLSSGVLTLRHSLCYEQSIGYTWNKLNSIFIFLFARFTNVNWLR